MANTMELGRGFLAVFGFSPHHNGSIDGLYIYVTYLPHRLRSCSTQSILNKNRFLLSSQFTYINLFNYVNIFA